MLTLPVFGPWRTIWDTVAGVKTRRLDELAAERNKGRQAPPRVELEVLGLVRSDLARVLIEEAELPSQSQTIASIRELAPLLTACAWPRWLLLEDALDEASRAGALHLAALVLRTQIEELDALRAVAELLALREDSPWDEERVGDALGIIPTRVLPRLRTKSMKELVEPGQGQVTGRPAVLQVACDQLDEYVHPNYGSHLLAVRPHDEDVARVISDAFVAVYEAFLALPWAREAPDGTPPGGRQATVDSPFLLLPDAILSVAPSLPQAPHVSSPPWTDALEVFAQRAARERSAEQDAVLLATSGQTPQADAAVEALESSASPEPWPEPLDTESARMQYLALVRVEQDLVEQAAAVPTEGHDQDDARRLSVLVSGLAFAINVTEFKLESLARHAASLIAARNPLGAVLVVRSMLEHHAVSIELGDRLSVLWDRAQKAAPNMGRVADALAAAEKQIARVLAGSVASGAHARAWRTLWETLVKKPYNVMEPIRALEKKQPGLLRTYGLLSHVVHGSVCTGGDLLGTRAGTSKAGDSLVAQSALFLAELCKPASLLDRQAASMLAAHRLDKSREAGDAGASAGIKSAALLKGQKLKLGRDIHGAGTLDEPFRFRPGLVYVDAYAHYLQQEGIELVSRTPQVFDGKPGDRVEAADGTVIYFLNDTLEF